MVEHGSSGAGVSMCEDSGDRPALAVWGFQTTGGRCRPMGGCVVEKGE